MLTFIRRHRLTSLGLITGCLALLSNVALAANGPSPSLYSSLARSAPELNPTVLKSKLSAFLDQKSGKNSEFPDVSANG